MEESTFLLFSAISKFIVDFQKISVEDNSQFLPPLESLFTELAQKSELDWRNLTSCLCRMKDDIQNASSESAVNRVFPQLFIHGFCFAHECSALGLMDCAKVLYQNLLEHSSGIDDPRFGIERAKAHLEYGLLLMGERKWISSAEQLLSAVISAINSGTDDRELMDLLDSLYSDLLPHMTDGSYGQNRLKEVKWLVDHTYQNPPLFQDASETVLLHRAVQYTSADLPIQFTNLQISEESDVGQFGMSPMATNTGHGQESRIMKASSSGSGSGSGSLSTKLVTYPTSDDSGYMGL
jgi:hypothetical protein